MIYCDVEIHDDVLRDFTPLIRAEVMQAYEQAPRAAPSLNVGGWKSDDDLLARRHGALAKLRAEIVRHVQARVPHLEHRAQRVRGWAMVNQHGSHHPRHDHRSAVLSGVYYVDPGDLPSAPTVFELPHDRELCVNPVTGRLVLFTGHTFHRVPPYLGNRPRITIAFDLPKEG